MKTKDNPDYDDVQDIIWYHMQRLIETVRGKEDDAYAALYSDDSGE